MVVSRTVTCRQAAPAPASNSLLTRRLEHTRLPEPLGDRECVRLLNHHLSQRRELAG